MITTEGYRDILHIARHKKPHELLASTRTCRGRRYPIVRRRYRLTVPERIDKDGDVLVPLDEDEVRAQVRRLKEARVEAVSVCLLFSFLNPEHEQRVAEIVREEFPEAFLSVSSRGASRSTASTSASRPSASTPTSAPRSPRYVRRFDARAARA